MQCNQCGYMMSAFDKTCPRCATQGPPNRAVQPPAPPIPTPTAYPQHPYQPHQQQPYGAQPMPASSGRNPSAVIALVMLGVIGVLSLPILAIIFLTMLGGGLKEKYSTHPSPTPQVQTR